MSGGYPPGTENLSWAPWNLPDPELEKGQCPNCYEKNSFYGRTWVKGKGKQTRWICRNCWNTWE